MTLRERADPEPLRAFEWTTSEGPSGALVRAVSEAADVDPTDIEPLYDVVDPDALDALFATSGELRDQRAERIEFEYLDYVVSVQADGRGFLYDGESS